jgi:hypothetical protein
MHTLACGPFFSATGFFVSLFILLVVKPATYFAFIQAFRYRVSRDVPMSLRRAVGLTIVRTLVGAALIVGVAMAAGVLNGASVGSNSARPAVLWGFLAAERLVLWLCLGLYAGLRTRRLAGWCVSGVCIDLAYDVAVGVSLADQWLIHAGILLAVSVFIALLHRIGRRPSLRARFESSPRCTRCAYDLTGNLSGVCPECGTPATPSASGSVPRQAA